MAVESDDIKFGLGKNNTKFMAYEIPALDMISRDIIYSLDKSTNANVSIDLTTLKTRLKANKFLLSDENSIFKIIPAVTPR